MQCKLDIAEIPGFPGYTIRSDGKVFKHGIEKVISCKKGRSAKVIIRVNKKMYTLGLAKLMAEAFLPNPFHHSRVIFKDRNHHHCHRDNIAWVDEETYFYYCCPKEYRGKPKLIHDRETSAREATDIHLKKYYETLDAYWMQEAWKVVDRQFAEFSFWPQVMSACYMHFVDRVQRFSIKGDPAALMWFYARGEYIKQKKEISPYLPFKKLISSDESLRNLKKSYD